jgi:cephalosporin hydroxylase
MRTIAEIFRSYAVFDADGRHTNGTDKESNHRYGDAYENILLITNMRKDTKLIMEVGVADGSSLLAWSEVFPNAHCVGMDIHHSDKAYGPRIEFHLGDQRSLEDCRRVAANRQFDFICEDATHRLENTLLTLLYLWPFVKPGGLYVIEEFDNVGSLRENIYALWPNAYIINTKGPFGGIEPLVILRKQANAQ